MDDVLRFPLQPQCGRKDVKRNAFLNRWLLWDIKSAGPDNPNEVIWLFDRKQDEEAETSIHYVEDYRLGVRYIGVSGPRQQQVGEQILKTIPVYRREEVKTMANDAVTPQERIAAIRLVAASLNPAVFDPEWFALFLKAFADPDAEVRFDALYAVCYTDWTEFMDVLRRLSEDDPDEKVRDRAGILLQSFVDDFGAQPNKP